MNQSTLKLRRTRKYIALLSFLSALTAHACPTCIGRIKEKSPPFFSEEYYKPGKNGKKQSNQKKATTNTERKENKEKTPLKESQ